MFCSTLLGFIFGVALFKAFRRVRAWRSYYGCGGSGGGCSSYGRGRGYWRSYDNSGPDYGPGYGRGYGSASSSVATVNGRPLDDLVKGLELNERQQAEAAPVFAFVKARLGLSGARVEAALKTVAEERFDPTALLAELADLPEGVRKELVDGLEHVHTILITEQRDLLRKELQRR